MFQSKVNSTDKVFLPFEISIQLAGFTPNELRDSLPVIGDRPYSTVLFVGGKFSTINWRRFVNTSASVQIGMLGIYGPAKAIQTSIHSKSNQSNTIAPFNPAGWHNQISNGGELTAMFSLLKTKLIASQSLKQKINSGNKKKGWFQCSYIYGFNIGYLTQASLGISSRLGILHLANFSNDPFNVLSNVSQLTDKKNAESGKREKICEAYLFTSVVGSATAYNASLHGQIRNTAYRLPYSQTAFFNAQGKIGVGLTLNHFNLGYFVGIKSPEFWTDYTRIHYWAGFTAGISCN